MSKATKEFHIGDILTITDGALVSPRHMDGVYDILGYMTGESLFTHQLPRVARECEGPLKEQFPELAAESSPDFSVAPDKKAAVEAWVAEMVAKHGETREVRPLAAEDHTSIDPIAEMRMHWPDTEVIVVRPDGA